MKRSVDHKLKYYFSSDASLLVLLVRAESSGSLQCCICMLLGLSMCVLLHMESALAYFSSYRFITLGFTVSPSYEKDAFPQRQCFISLKLSRAVKS